MNNQSDISHANYTQFMTEEKKLYKAAILKAEQTNIEHNGEPSTVEAAYYNEAASICTEIMKKNQEQKAVYTQWETRKEECQAEARRIMDALTPEAPDIEEESETTGFYSLDMPGTGNDQPSFEETDASHASGEVCASTVTTEPAATSEYSAAPDSPTLSAPIEFNVSPAQGITMSNGKKDLLNREELIDQIMDIIKAVTARREYISFSINGSWGSGKSFLLDMLKDRLNEAPDDYLVINYNCWQYDYYDEPLVAICETIIECLTDNKEMFGKEEQETCSLIIRTALRIAGKFVENKTGFNPAEISDDIRDDTQKDMKKADELNNYSPLQKQLSSIRKKLEEITREKTIIVIVDELDRCVPSYAIKFLERLHHIYHEIPNLIMISAINYDQLQASITQLFGEQVDAARYLKKFISFGITLDSGNLGANFTEKYKSYFSKFTPAVINNDKTNLTGEPAATGQSATHIIYSNHNGINFKELVNTLFHSMDMRDIEQLMERIQMVHSYVFQDVIVDQSIMYYELIYGVLTGQYRMDMNTFLTYDDKAAASSNAAASGNAAADEKSSLLPVITFSQELPPAIKKYFENRWDIETIPVKGTGTYLKPAQYEIREMVLLYLTDSCQNQPFRADELELETDSYTYNRRHITKFKKLFDILQ